MILKILIIIHLIFVMSVKYSFTQDTNEKIELISIVAIVNDEPITMLDLDARFKLIIISSNLPNNEKTRKNLYGQVIQSLINEILQSQEAKKLGIRVTNAEIENNIRFIENQNNLNKGELIETLYQNGVPKSALPTRLKANLITEKLLQQVIRPKVIINQNEINNEYNNYISNVGKIEFKFSEILFPFSNLSTKEDLMLIAKQLRKQIIEKDNFDIIGERIKENGTGKYIKNTNWTLSSNLNKNIYESIKKIEKDNISELIITNTGISIIRLDNKRKFKIPDLSMTVEDISFISFDLPINKNKTESLIKEIKEKSLNIKSCGDMTEMVKIIGNKKGRYLGKVLLQNLPEYFRKEINKLNINQPSNPIVTDDGIYITMICARNNQLNQEFAIKEMIKTNIKSRYIITLKERYLLDLNRKALIDIRM